ncbi:MAG: hypothetical protein HYU36_12430 [Planctomycetes bacterium]|nr:hypothetical protein [Planctomycetota bacterium]
MKVNWLEPWHPTSPGLERELEREVGPGHVLFGRRAVAVARRFDADDVLFHLPDGPTAFADVHLTWSCEREKHPECPSTVLYASLEDWIQNGMRRDHEEWKR